MLSLKFNNKNNDMNTKKIVGILRAVALTSFILMLLLKFFSNYNALTSVFFYISVVSWVLVLFFFLYSIYVKCYID